MRKKRSTCRAGLLGAPLVSLARGVDGGETATGVLVEGGVCERIFTPLERLC